MFIKYFHTDKFVPQIRLSSFADLMTKKGLFSMNAIETTLIEAFQSQNIDIGEKTIADAPQKLYIVASNMTTQNVTIFSGKVRILDAIKCSSCLPIVFEPQILYNQVYLDGGIFVNSLASIAPEHAIILHISPPAENIFPNEIGEMTIPVFLHRVYRNMQSKPTHKNLVWLQNNTIGILQDLKPEDKELLYNEGYSQTLAFLTKRFAQELK